MASVAHEKKTHPSLIPRKGGAKEADQSVDAHEQRTGIKTRKSERSRQKTGT